MLGIVAGLVVTVGAMASGSSEAIVGIALCWVALIAFIAFIAMERFADRISGFTQAGQRRTAYGPEMSRRTEMRGRVGRASLTG